MDDPQSSQADDDLSFKSLEEPPVFPDQIFDSTSEILKGLVREIFHFNKSAVDGLCAAAIHITQSQHFKGYY